MAIPLQVVLMARQILAKYCLKVSSSWVGVMVSIIYLPPQARCRWNQLPPLNRRPLIPARSPAGRKGGAKGFPEELNTQCDQDKWPQECADAAVRANLVPSFDEFIKEIEKEMAEHEESISCSGARIFAEK